MKEKTEKIKSSLDSNKIMSVLRGKAKAGRDKLLSSMSASRKTPTSAANLKAGSSQFSSPNSRKKTLKVVSTSGDARAARKQRTLNTVENMQ